MNTFNCIAIDDEPIALNIIRQFANRMGGLTVTTFTDPIEGLKFLNDNPPHIVFLDVEMQELNGIDLAKQIPNDICIIFTTAYIKYAYEGFNLDATDFLHKPFAYNRFVVAIEKAQRRLSFLNKELSSDTITLNQDYKKRTISLNDIVYVEAMENYCRVHLSNKDVVTSRVNLKSIISMLPEANFIRIHRSFIVRKDKITSYNRREITLYNDTRLPVGRQFTNNLPI